MRILLLGELSGVHQELAPALKALGHVVVVGHSRLAQPEFKSDIDFARPSSDRGPRMEAFRDIMSQLYNAPKLTGFDVVQVITPKFFNWKIHGPMMRFLKRNNQKMVVISASCSSDYYRRVQELTYRPCKECLQFDQKSDRCVFDRPQEQQAEYAAYDAADAIVATHFEYAFALHDTRFADKMVNIPLPIDTVRHRQSPMPPLAKLRIWYGETRYGFKGSHFILPALDRLQSGPLGNGVEILRTGRLAFDEYLDLLSTVHIAIDQASSYSMGMNALYPLARGRVVLSGAEPEMLDFVGVSSTDNPIVNIRPDVDQIHDTLVDLIGRKADLPALGQKSAAYVERFHSARKIALAYLSLYSTLVNETTKTPEKEVSE